jgi:hypothetical protein
MLSSRANIMTSEEFANREWEVQQAIEAYPQDEMSESYRRWKETRGEEPTSLHTNDPTIVIAKQVIQQQAWRPCEKCGGRAVLEAVCGGCVEGRKGFKSKFTCEACLHRELSKKEYTEWLKDLTSSLQNES